MKKKKNNFFLKKEFRKKSFLIRKQTCINKYDASFNAAKNFFSFLKVRSNDIIGCYWPINNEIDTRPLISILSLKKIKLALPIIEKKKMFFKEWKVKDKLYFSQYKFYSPNKSSKTISPNIIITPALAVDYKGNRIGYGKGFYDSYYNRNKSKIYIGFIYTDQIFSTLPFEEHDLKLNAVVTDNLVKNFNLNSQ